MKYLVQAVGVLVLVAIGLRVAAWLVAPIVPALVTLFVGLALLTGLLLPNFWSRRGS